MTTKLTCNEMMVLLACYRGTLDNEWRVRTRAGDLRQLVQRGLLLDLDGDVSTAGNMRVREALGGSSRMTDETWPMDECPLMERKTPCPVAGICGDSNRCVVFELESEGFEVRRVPAQPTGTPPANE